MEKRANQAVDDRLRINYVGKNIRFFVLFCNWRRCGCYVAVPCAGPCSDQCAHTCGISRGHSGRSRRSGPARDRSLRTVLYFIMYGSPIRYVHHMHTLRYAQRVHQHRTCAHDDSSMYSMSCACAPQHTLPYFIVNFGSRHRHGHAPHPNQSYS